MTWEAVIARYNLTLIRVKDQYRGPCPIHGGTNPTAFVITPSKGFHCFGCGAGGGVAQFIRAMGDIPDMEKRGSFWLPPVDARPDIVTPLSPLDPTHRYFQSRGLHEATARFFGMGYFAGKPPLGARIIIPLHDADGKLVGHLGRAIDDKEPRYWFQQCVPRRSILFNFHRVKAARHETVVLVEGAFDCAALHQLGFSNTVASLSCHVTENQRALLSRFRRVLILFDDDLSGSDAMVALKEELGRSAVCVPLPKADPCSLKGVVLSQILRKNGVDARG